MENISPISKFYDEKMKNPKRINTNSKMLTKRFKILDSKSFLDQQTHTIALCKTGVGLFIIPRATGAGYRV